MDESEQEKLDAQVAQAIVETTAAPVLPDDRLVSIYRKIRDAKSTAKREYESQEAEFNRQMKTISSELLRRCRERGQTGMQTAAGTVYIAEEMKVSCGDWGIFYDFVRETGSLEMFEQRIKVGEIKNYMNAHGGELPPGVSVFREYEARVRKPTKRGDKAVDDGPAEQ